MKGFWRSGIAAAALLVLLASAAALRTKSARAGADETGVINDMLQKQTDDWNRGDVEAFMSGYWKSPDTEFVGAGGIIRGWEGVMARYRRDYPDKAAMGHLTFSDQKIHMLGPDSAYVLGEFHLHRASGDFSGVYTLIVKKLPEGWRIVHDHSTAFKTP